MPIKTIETDDSLGYLVKGEGIVTGEEVSETILEFSSKPEQQQTYRYSIVDYTEITQMSVSLEYICKTALKMNEVFNINPQLIVAARNKISYSLSKLWCLAIGVKGMDVKVFRSRNILDAWLNKKIKEKHGDIYLKLN